METLILYALLTSSAFYLGSRAVITQAIWSRYPHWLARFMDCAACAGFWYGLAFSLLLGSEIPSPFGTGILGPILTGLGAIVWTPIVSGYMQTGLEHLGSAVEDSDGGK